MSPESPEVETRAVHAARARAALLAAGGWTADAANLVAAADYDDARDAASVVARGNQSGE